VPTYSYRCTECDNAFDIVQSFTDDTLSVCPVCGGKLRKVFSPIGVSFTGSGFYRTDSRAAASSSASASPSTSAPAPSSSDSKPAKKEPAAKPASPAS